jgi:hypothetical protein
MCGAKCRRQGAVNGGASVVGDAAPGLVVHEFDNQKRVPYQALQPDREPFSVLA